MYYIFLQSKFVSCFKKVSPWEIGKIYYNASRHITECTWSEFEIYFYNNCEIWDDVFDGLNLIYNSAQQLCFCGREDLSQGTTAIRYCVSVTLVNADPAAWVVTHSHRPWSWYLIFVLAITFIQSQSIFVYMFKFILSKIVNLIVRIFRQHKESETGRHFSRIVNFISFFTDSWLEFDMLWMRLERRSHHLHPSQLFEATHGIPRCGSHVASILFLRFLSKSPLFPSPLPTPFVAHLHLRLCSLHFTWEKAQYWYLICLVIPL